MILGFLAKVEFLEKPSSSNKGDMWEQLWKEAKVHQSSKRLGKVFSSGTAVWQECPQPLLQHFCPLGQESSPEQNSAQSPIVPFGNTGHFPGLCSTGNLTGLTAACSSCTSELSMSRATRRRKPPNFMLLLESLARMQQG